jgi:hypothetical protein
MCCARRAGGRKDRGRAARVASKAAAEARRFRNTFGGIRQREVGNGRALSKTQKVGSGARAPRWEWVGWVDAMGTKKRSKASASGGRGLRCAAPAQRRQSRSSSHASAARPPGQRRTGVALGPGARGPAGRRSVAAAHDELHEAARPLEGGRGLLQAVLPLLGGPRLGQLVDLGAHLWGAGREREGEIAPAAAGQLDVAAAQQGGPPRARQRRRCRPRSSSPMALLRGRTPPPASPRPAAAPRPRCTCRTPAPRCPGSWTTPGARGGRVVGWGRGGVGAAGAGSGGWRVGGGQRAAGGGSCSRRGSAPCCRSCGRQRCGRSSSCSSGR